MSKLWLKNQLVAPQSSEHLSLRKAETPLLSSLGLGCIPCKGSTAPQLGGAGRGGLMWIQPSHHRRGVDCDTDQGYWATHEQRRAWRDVSRHVCAHSTEGQSASPGLADFRVCVCVWGGQGAAEGVSCKFQFKIRVSLRGCPHRFIGLCLVLSPEEERGPVICSIECGWPWTPCS